MIVNATVTVQTLHVHLATEGMSLTLDNITNRLQGIKVNQDEMTVALEAAAVKAEKVAAEVTAAVTQMAAAIAAAGQSTPAQEAALARLNGALTIADAANPDVPANPAAPLEVIAP